VSALGTGEEDQSPIWQPNPGPQTLALHSEADILGYGGSAGGGKTDLLLGLAALHHKRSVIFRRIFPSLRGIIERSREIFNAEGRDHGKNSYNESLHRWSLSDGKQIEFEACQYEKDREKQRGRPRDFYGFDEVTEFTRSQVEFIIAWNRTTLPNQRCRVVMTFNPPTDEAGNWVVSFFLPWLAYLYPNNFQHPNPAAPGELRWYATVDGKEVECENGQPFQHEGETITPRSRSFIPARLSDNPHLENTGYRAVLQSLPEPLRSQLLNGDFSATAEPDPWQVIPAEWVRQAQKRWQEMERPNRPISGVGVDVARGGRDKTTISKRYGYYFDEVIAYPGIVTPDGPAVAQRVQQAIGEENPPINIDVIGVGSSAYDSLKEMYQNVTPINVGERSSHRDRSNKFAMKNKRAEIYWRLREALDPQTGDNLCLPPGNEVLADLCAARYKLTSAGIQIESKDEIKERIGRSPDIGEAILLAHMAYDRIPIPAMPESKSRWTPSAKDLNGSRWRR
jgi:hypothetical protein